MMNLSPYIACIIIAVIAAFTSGLSIPKIILLAKKKRLFDLPDNNRKIHKEVVPNLGGVAIFFSFIIIASLFAKTAVFPTWNYLVASATILFVVGIKDDIVSLSPAKKFLAQILAAIITVILADVRLHSLHGIFGIYEMPSWVSIIFSIIGCVFITNAFNLIDGIDGLAGTIGILCALALGGCLLLQHNYGAAYVCFALVGGLVGFLRYNIAPARIFMGDSGSLFLGFTISVMSITLVNTFETPHNLLASFIHSTSGALLFTLSVLFIPVFDSFRVFLTRIAKGKHPFHADRTHLHHYLLDLGFSHSNTVTTLVTANLLIITITLLVQDLNPTLAIAIITAVSFGLYAILYQMRKVRLKKTEFFKSKLANLRTEQNEKAHHENPTIGKSPETGLPMMSTEGT
ncbi:MAG: undecaprenyl/decaprenyl-phosphate alpha-N-acetylglucosaminyl 1-phosphate transferase [Bacteroidetes bacterium]|nr:undecaprenyl/decaprenyl-phosphate alpha-N-acetylglucosaminyl 1-phosphate transferase [Bacteroidota bacterium]MBS1740684.1 undecaprenyl/decaprenyl-phosphate alpha-N-acetylglucosaminyl 1-phosphate transferase [Bacteroidota bacterium]MBS1775792.1 undecaprenyl/decaprenyl-phosphate alpha-N-acetylglucosaminyl 1-phosphate transferase [Bacteroidota bacterium]